MVSHDSDTDWDSDYDEIPANAYTQQRQASAAKARESMNERTPLLAGSPPPPAYAEATRDDANRSHGESSSQQRDGNDSGEPRLFSSDHPQSMSSHTADPENGKKKKPRARWVNLKSLVVLGVILLVSIIMVSVIGTKNASNGDGDTGDDDGGNIGGGEEKSPNPPYGTTPGSPHRSGCHLQDFTESQWFGFGSPKSFSLVELSKKATHISGSIGGKVRIQNAPADQSAAIMVGVKYATSGVHMSQLNVQAESESLRLEVPHLTTSNSYSCVDIQVTMFVRPDVALENFEIATETLDIRADDDLFSYHADTDSTNQNKIYISNSSLFATISGDVSMSYWSSRETRVELVSGQISGRFALRDLLFVKTQSGSIGITVDPKPVDKEHSKPAQFTALSTSGSIKTYFPTSGTATEIPEREYHSTVETSSGSVDGDYILGAYANFRTNSGSIKVQVLPYTSEASSFSTTTQNGQIVVHLLAPFKDPRNAIRNLRSQHTSTSASLSIRYPQQWEGTIEGLTLSGSLVLKGRDVRVTRRFKGPVGNQIVAQKGSGESMMNMKTTSGSIDAVVGDEY